MEGKVTLWKVYCISLSSRKNKLQHVYLLLSVVRLGVTLVQQEVFTEE